MNKMYSEEAVEKALELVALGVAGILSKDDAEATLNKLPEDLAKMVIAATLAAHETQKIVLGSLKETLEKVAESDNQGISNTVCEMIRNKWKRETPKV